MLGITINLTRICREASTSNAFNRWTATEHQKKAALSLGISPRILLYVGNFFLHACGLFPHQIWEAYADTLLTEAGCGVSFACKHARRLRGAVFIENCQDFSYHPFRLAACSPAEMPQPYINLHAS